MWCKAGDIQMGGMARVNEGLLALCVLLCAVVAYGCVNFQNLMGIVTLMMTKNNVIIGEYLFTTKNASSDYRHHNKA